ncbi:MAG: P-II family nitrogen regulator [Syntrophorhabdales bacterium]
MLMIRAIVRPEKVDTVLERLMAEGFPAVTRLAVSGFVSPVDEVYTVSSGIKETAAGTEEVAV